MPGKRVLEQGIRHLACLLCIGHRVGGGALPAAMDGRFSLCLCHPRSQPARSDNGIPTRASRTSFTRPFPFLPGVILDPAFGRLLPMRTGHRRAGRGRHRDDQNAVRVELHGCACLEIIKPCLQSLRNGDLPKRNIFNVSCLLVQTASYLCVPVTTSEDGAVIEPSRMPFESSCPWLRLSWN
ncbi:uncharacterized protein LOC144178459 isoform X1 [Haemaphysalis longicornis]